jgi:hypothetical protein
MHEFPFSALKGVQRAWHGMLRSTGIVFVHNKFPYGDIPGRVVCMIQLLFYIQDRLCRGYQSFFSGRRILCRAGIGVEGNKVMASSLMPAGEPSAAFSSGI